MVKIKDIPYLGATCPIRMDAWLPEEGSYLPACILIHGGGWTTGDKADEREQNMAADLCALGCAVFSINYRMNEYENGPYQGKRLYCAWPQCILDCMDAVSYVRINANKYGVGAEHICAVGSSAGGHLSLLLATAWEDKQLNCKRLYPDVSCKISGAISCYGVPNILNWGGDLLMPESYEQSKEEWKLASPSARLHLKYPPVMLIHGDRDETVDVMQSVHFYHKLYEKGNHAQLIIVKEGGHSFDFSILTYSQRKEIETFLFTCFGKEKSI